MYKIPKIIHYCWFGGGRIPDLDMRCIESWKRFCPDYEIKLWNENNYDINKNSYMKQAYESKLWGFVPDYARLDILYEYGGFYLDTDVELVKNLDPLRENEAFMGFESSLGNEDKFINLGQMFGSVKHNKLIKEIRDVYDNISFINQDGTYNLLPSPHYTTRPLLSKGLKRNNTLQLIDNVTIYPAEYFCPMYYGTRRVKVTKNTYSIHHFNASWYNDKERKYYKKVVMLNRLVGIKNSTRLLKVYYRFKRLFKDNK